MRTAYLAVVDGLNPEALPSMAQDVLAHRKTEVEAFAGQVIQLAEFYGMAVPVNRDLYEKLQAIETNWRREIVKVDKRANSDPFPKNNLKKNEKND